MLLKSFSVPLLLLTAAVSIASAIIGVTVAIDIESSVTGH